MFKYHLCSCCKFVLGVFFVIAIALGFILFITAVDNYFNYISFSYRGVFDAKSSPALSIAAFNVICQSALIFLTLIIAAIAWFQLKGLRKTTRGDFLMRIDNSFHDEKIQDAFGVIYMLDRKSTKKCADHKLREPHCSSCEDAVSQDMKDRLTKIWYSKKEEDIRKRFNISSYLDFLETLAYFVNAEYISLDDIDNLHGGIIKYHCSILCDWISNVRKNQHDAYSQLIRLCDKLPD